MSEDTHAEGEQLFDTQSDEVADDSANDSEESENEDKETSDLNSEEEQEQKLNLEVKTIPKGEESKLKQIKALQSKLDKGEITIEDIKPAQKWAKEYLKESSTVDHKTIIKDMIEEEKTKVKFETLKDELQNANLPSGKLKLIEDEWKFFKNKGLSSYEALETARKIAGVDLDEIDVSERKRRMAIPKAGRPGKKDITSMPYEDIAKSMPEEDRKKYLRELIKN